MDAHTATAKPPDVSRLMLLREDIAGIAVLTLNHPETRNSLSEAMLEALGDALTAIAHDDSVRAVVLAANGPAFSAGHDLKELSRHRSDADGGRAYFKHIMRTVQRHDAADRHAAAAGHRRGAGDRNGGGLPAGGELRPRGRLAAPRSSPRLASISACSARPRWSRCRAMSRASTRWKCC